MGKIKKDQNSIEPRNLGPDSMTGHCLCGAVQIKITAAPLWVAHCHCPSCRRATASAFATYVGFDAKHVLISREDLGEFSSSPGVLRRFCKKCGSPIAFQGERWPGEIHLHLGVLDQPHAYKPERHIHCRTMLGSIRLNDDLPQHRRFDEE